MAKERGGNPEDPPVDEEPADEDPPTDVALEEDATTEVELLPGMDVAVEDEDALAALELWGPLEEDT